MIGYNLFLGCVEIRKTVDGKRFNIEDKAWVAGVDVRERFSSLIFSGLQIII